MFYTLIAIPLTIVDAPFVRSAGTQRIVGSGNRCSPTLAMTVRRVHDLGKTLVLVPDRARSGRRSDCSDLLVLPAGRSQSQPVGRTFEIICFAS